MSLDIAPYATVRWAIDREDGHARQPRLVCQLLLQSDVYVQTVRWADWLGKSLV